MQADGKVFFGHAGKQTVFFLMSRVHGDKEKWVRLRHPIKDRVRLEHPEYCFGRCTLTPVFGYHGPDANAISIAGVIKPYRL